MGVKVGFDGHKFRVNVWVTGLLVAIEKADCFLVIHVMPTHYRKAGR